MSDNITSILDKYRPGTKSEATTVPEELSTTGKQSYHAFGVDAPRSRLTRLMIHYHDGVVALMSYAYLIEAVATSHQYLSLIFTNCIITLEGRNLTKMLDLLQDERVVYLQCFHSERFEKPEDGEPIITAIERQGVKEFGVGKTKEKN